MSPLLERMGRMSSITIKISGLEKLYDKMRKAEAEMWPTIMSVIEKYVKLMVEEAKKNVPEDTGAAKESIGYEIDNEKKEAIFYVSSAHAAIQEFGFNGAAGNRMDIPPELEDEAKKFKGYKEGNFEDFLEALKGWVVRKGLPEESAFPIAKSILHYGLAPQPFFHPAYIKYKDKMIKEIDKKLKKLFDF